VAAVKGPAVGTNYIRPISTRIAAVFWRQRRILISFRGGGVFGSFRLLETGCESRALSPFGVVG
jgi:hypothetical protein